VPHSTRGRAVAGAALGLTIAAGTLAACATQAEPPAPVTTASSSDAGDLAGYRSSRSNCYAKFNPDDTANVRLYNSIQTAGVKDFALATTATDTTILMANYEKRWENGAAGEGQYECASVPYLVENNGAQSYYYWQGDLWTGHPGWWGHTKNVSWEDSPLGWVRFKCDGKRVVTDEGEKITPRVGCPDPNLATGYVEAPWNTDSKGNTLQSPPSCTTTNTVIGCWTRSYYGGPPDGDFVFDTTAWTSPMRIALTTDFIADAAGNYVVWEIADASLASAVWADQKSPRGQSVRRGGSLYVGGYAVASNGKHSINLTLKPKGLVDPSGASVVCRKVGQVSFCRPFERAESIEAIAVQRGAATITTTESHELLAGDSVTISGAADGANNGTFTVTKATDKTFTVTNPRAVAQTGAQGSVAMAAEPAPNLGVDLVVTISVTLTLAQISNKEEGGSGKPVPTPSFDCSANVKTVGSQNIEVACAKAGEPFTYGGAWSVVIKN
jgi:hypothetical protein